MANVTPQMLKVMRGFSSLDYGERKELLEWIEKYQSDAVGRTALMESFAKAAGVSLGPIGSGSCPCCGK